MLIFPENTNEWQTLSEWVSEWVSHSVSERVSEWVVSLASALLTSWTLWWLWGNSTKTSLKHRYHWDLNLNLECVGYVLTRQDKWSTLDQRRMYSKDLRCFISVIFGTPYGNWIQTYSPPKACPSTAELECQLQRKHTVTSYQVNKIIIQKRSKCFERMSSWIYSS